MSLVRERLDQLGSRDLDRERIERELRSTQEEAVARLDGARAERDRLYQRVVALERELRLISESTSWLASAPLRRLLEPRPVLARLVRRGLKLAWWVLTLQLADRWRRRTSARKAIAAGGPAGTAGTGTTTGIAGGLVPNPRDPGSGERPTDMARAEPIQSPGAPLPAGPGPGPEPTCERVEVEPTDGEIARLEALGVLNAGWYGSEPIRLSDRYRQAPVPGTALIEAAKRKYQRDTLELHRLYLDGQPALPPWAPEKFLPFATTDRHIAALQPARVPDSSADPGFSVVTSVRASLDYFEQAAQSVAAIDVAWNAGTVEWVINNDDPGVPNEMLVDRIPLAIRPHVRVIGGNASLGVSQGLNRAIAAARNEWTLVLDSDDRILPEVVEVLRHYIRRYPRCRWISSARIEFDDRNAVLRFRRHTRPPANIYSAGMIAGHLKAIRRDVFDEVGLLDSGCELAEDWDMALRVAEREPLLLIPDYLYAYRFHLTSQSYVRRYRQELSRRNVLRRHARRRLEEADRSALAAPRSGRSSRRVRRGATIIPTRAGRLDLLSEAVASAERQILPLTPVIVVQGNDATRDMVARRYGGSAAIVLATAEPAATRGDVLNVGLDYVTAHADQFDFVGFLDDVDIHYPDHAARIATALEFSGAELVHAEVNRREPWREHTVGRGLMPAVCLVAGNCISLSATALRVDALLRSGVKFERDMEYLEDWQFLISLMAAGTRFAPLFETVGEFRVPPDGRADMLRASEARAACERRCLDRGAVAARALGLPWFFASLTEFDFDARRPLDAAEQQLILDARDVFENAGADAAKGETE